MYELFFIGLGKVRSSQNKQKVVISCASYNNPFLPFLWFIYLVSCFSLEDFFWYFLIYFTRKFAAFVYLYISTHQEDNSK